jgi:hypothetical protein
MTSADDIRSALEMRRGITYRVYPGGRRMMIHRWDYRRIKGAKPMRSILFENLYSTNKLLQALLLRRT